MVHDPAAGDVTPADDDPGGGAGAGAHNRDIDPAGAAIPKELRLIGLAVGLLVLAFGAWLMWFDKQLYTIGVLFVCVGFGIILTVFGTIIGGRFLNFNVVGGGALAVALFLLVQKFPIDLKPLGDRYVIGEIIDSDQFVSVRVQGKSLFLTGRESPNGNFRFIALESDIGDKFVAFKFGTNNEGQPGEFTFYCVDSIKLRSALEFANSKVTYAISKTDDGKFRLLDSEENSPVGQLNSDRCGADPVDANINNETAFLDWLLPSAHAQEAESTISIDEALTLLESDDGDQRDLARAALAKLRTPQDYMKVTTSWDVRASSYRADLGRLVAWSSAIEQQRKTAVTLAMAISPLQMQYLVQMSGQGDFTLRQYATEVLHRLLETTSWEGGPSPTVASEIVMETLRPLSSNPAQPIDKSGIELRPENLIYNTIVAINYAACNIGREYRPMVIASLTDLTSRLEESGDAPKTLAKLTGTLRTFEECG